MSELYFFAPGTPGAKGSKSFKGMMRLGNGRTTARLLESSKKVKPWEDAVCRALFPRQPLAPFPGAVELTLEFRFARPASHGRKRWPCWGKDVGDVDKLARSTLDALTRAGAWADDAQVIKVTASKRYCEAGEEPGCLIHARDPSPGLVKPKSKGKRDAGRTEGAGRDGRGRGRKGAGRSAPLLDPFI